MQQFETIEILLANNIRFCLLQGKMTSATGYSCKRLQLITFSSSHLEKAENTEPKDKQRHLFIQPWGFLLAGPILKPCGFR